MQVLKFLNNYKDDVQKGLEALKSEFMIEHKVLNGKVLLKYHREADKNLEIVRECRGLILNYNTLEPVSTPLLKWGNYGESYAHNDIDITKSKVLEKVDGTCIGLYWCELTNKWQVQTLKQIEAEETVKGWAMNSETDFTWAELFWTTFKNYSGLELLNKLDKDYTYIFELCTQWNRVVIKYDKPTIFFLALKNKKTLKEEHPENCILYTVFDKPKLYDYSNIDTILKIAKEQLTKDEEGFILVDDNFQRIKIKSAQYVAEHYKSTVITINTIVEIVLQNEQDEWLISFPEYKELIDIIKEEIKLLGERIDTFYKDCISKLEDKTSRKELALMIKDIYGIEKSFAFQLFTGKIKNGIEGIMKYDKEEELTKKAKTIIENTKISERIKHNESTGSLRG
jgi:hypothetical protein